MNFYKRKLYIFTVILIKRSFSSITHQFQLFTIIILYLTSNSIWSVVTAEPVYFCSESSRLFKTYILNSNVLTLLDVRIFVKLLLSAKKHDDTYLSTS